jgi:hypothetical protein
VRTERNEIGKVLTKNYEASLKTVFVPAYIKVIKIVQK